MKLSSRTGPKSCSTLQNSNESFTKCDEKRNNTGCKISASHLAISCCAQPTIDKIGLNGIGSGLCTFGRPYILGRIDPVGRIRLYTSTLILFCLTFPSRNACSARSFLAVLSCSSQLPKSSNFVESFNISIIFATYSALSIKTVPAPLSGLVITMSSL